MSTIHLKPNESIKLSSTAFKLISEKVKKDIFNIDPSEAKEDKKENHVYQIKYTEFEPKVKEKIIHEMKIFRNGYKPENDIDVQINQKISKVLITEMCDPEKLDKIKSAVANRIDLHEKQIKYSEEINKEKKKKFKEKNRRSDYIKVHIETHPRGRHDLEMRKYQDLEDRIAIPATVPTKKETRFIRTVKDMESVYDLYSNQSWSIRDIQKFINLYFEYHKEFEKIQSLMPNKTTSEIIALYDIINPVLLLKKIYKKCKRKSPANKKEFLRKALPMIKEKLMFILKDKIIENYSNEAVITLGEASISRRSLIETFAQYRSY